MRYFQEASAAVLALGLAVSFAATLILRALDISTKPGDAQGFSGAAKAMFEVLLRLPPVVTGALLVALLGMIFYVLRPDRSHEKMRQDYKRLNEKAYAFEPQFLAMTDKLSAERVELADALKRIDETHRMLTEQLATMKDDIRDEVIREISRTAGYKVDEAISSLESKVMSLVKTNTDGALHHHRRSVDRLQSDINKINSKISALPQPPQDTGSETQP